jgi:hypothetical protein
MLNLYPPFVFQAIRVTEVGDDFSVCTVRVGRSLRTRNLHGTTFGGSIYAAADPIYAILLWQIFAKRGVRVQAWLRGAKVRYLHPAASTLTLRFELTQDDIAEAERALRSSGRWSRWFTTEARDRDNDTCAIIETEAYLRLPRAGQREVSGF